MIERVRAVLVAPGGVPASDPPGPVRPCHLVGAADALALPEPSDGGRRQTWSWQLWWLLPMADRAWSGAVDDECAEHLAHRFGIAAHDRG